MYFLRITRDKAILPGNFVVFVFCQVADKARKAEHNFQIASSTRRKILKFFRKVWIEADM